MKTKYSTAALVTALIGTSIALTGCGSNNNGAGTGTVGVASGVAGVTGINGAITAAGGSFSFSGPNAYYSGPTLADNTPGFTPGQSTGDLTLGTTTVASASSQLTGYTQYGSTITILAAPDANSCPWGTALCASVTGVVTLSAQEMAAAGLSSGLPQVIGFGMSLQISGAQISGGYADVCVTRDQAGNCHGIQLNFMP